MLYLVEAVDEYCITALPEFEGKKFQNVAKEGFTLSEADKDRHEAAVKAFEPLTKWLNDEALKDQVYTLSLRSLKKKLICFHYSQLGISPVRTLQM